MPRIKFASDSRPYIGIRYEHRRVHRLILKLTNWPKIYGEFTWKTNG